MRFGGDGGRVSQAASVLGGARHRRSGGGRRRCGRLVAVIVVWSDAVLQ